MMALHLCVLPAALRIALPVVVFLVFPLVMPARPFPVIMVALCSCVVSSVVPATTSFVVLGMLPVVMFPAMTGAMFVLVPVMVAVGMLATIAVIVAVVIKTVVRVIDITRIIPVTAILMAVAPAK